MITQNLNLKKEEEEDWSNSTAEKAIALHLGNLGSILGIPYNPPNLSGTPEYCPM